MPPTWTSCAAAYIASRFPFIARCWPAQSVAEKKWKILVTDRPANDGDSSCRGQQLGASHGGRLNKHIQGLPGKLQYPYVHRLNP